MFLSTTDLIWVAVALLAACTLFSIAFRRRLKNRRQAMLSAAVRRQIDELKSEAASAVVRRNFAACIRVPEVIRRIRQLANEADIGLPDSLLVALQKLRLRALEITDGPTKIPLWRPDLAELPALPMAPLNEVVILGPDEPDNGDEIEIIVVGQPEGPPETPRLIEEMIASSLDGAADQGTPLAVTDQPPVAHPPEISVFQVEPTGGAPGAERAIGPMTLDEWARLEQSAAQPQGLATVDDNVQPTGPPEGERN